MGYAWVSIGQHWVSHPTVWPQPFPVLARLAPETGAMRLKTSVLLLPILNAVEMAENVATLDHICHGRLDVGVAIGYREKELEAAGLTRRDRVPKLEESIALMKRLWTGEEVTFDGRYTRVTAGRMGFPPYQQPHPPLEMGAQSVGATARAARLTDGVFFGPQVAWRDIAKLAAIFRDARAAAGIADAGQRRRLAEPHRGAHRRGGARGGARPISSGRSTMYRTWEMQERSMVALQLDFDRSLDDWTVNGSPRDCVETDRAAAASSGSTRSASRSTACPREAQARIDYLQMIAEEILAPAGALA